MNFFKGAIEQTDWTRDLRELLKKSKQIQPVTQRTAFFAQALCGRPYAAFALHGGPQQDERLLLDLSGFDCVTFVENVLALARARDLAGYVAELLQLRYRGGQIHWAKRLHYFSDWLEHNSRRQVLRRLRCAEPLVYQKRLDQLPGYPARDKKLSVCPRPRLHLLNGKLAPANVVAFASTRGGIDYFHVGLLLHTTGQKTLDAQLLHASRSGGGVVREPLADFLRRNRTRGLSLARVQEF